MNTANKLTILRILLIPLFFLVLYWDFKGNNYVALAIFAIASATDFVDGYIARHRNQVTTFGKFLDPLADKILVFSALVWFIEIGIFPAWAAALVVAREFAVTGLRLVAVGDGVVIAAAPSGKVKTACTMVCILIMFLPVPNVVNTICTWIIVVTTLYSGVEYFIKNKNVINITE